MFPCSLSVWYDRWTDIARHHQRVAQPDGNETTRITDHKYVARSEKRQSRGCGGEVGCAPWQRGAWRTASLGSPGRGSSGGSFVEPDIPPRCSGRSRPSSDHTLLLDHDICPRDPSRFRPDSNLPARSSLSLSRTRSPHIATA